MYILKEDNPLFGKKGRKMSDSVYNCLDKGDQELFFKKPDSPFDRSLPVFNIRGRGTTSTINFRIMEEPVQNSLEPEDIDDDLDFYDDDEDEDEEDDE